MNNKIDYLLILLLAIELKDQMETRFQKTTDTVTSPSKNDCKQLFQNNKGWHLIFGYNHDDDSMNLIEEDDDDEQEKSEITYQKRKLAEKQYGKYDLITKTEIFGINNYCRDSLWRRAKFINDKQLGD